MKFVKAVFSGVKYTLPLFGMIAFIVAIGFGLFFESRSILTTDDPYIIGMVIATIYAIAGEFYFISEYYRQGSGKWWFSTSISIVVLYFLFVEFFVGGEASGYGYMFITWTLAGLPPSVFYLYYHREKLMQVIAYICAVIFVTGFLFMAIGR